MSSPSRWLPIGLIGLGTILVVVALASPLINKITTEISSAPIPAQVSGLSIVSEATGNAALQEFSELHGKSFPILSGAKASYGSGSQITIWVAGTDSATTAHQLLEAMRTKIAQGNSPFQSTGTRQTGKQTIYTLDGMGQKHFYFLSGKYLIWLASTPEKADQALQQVLDFYK